MKPSEEIKNLNPPKESLEARLNRTRTLSSELITKLFQQSVKVKCDIFAIVVELIVTFNNMKCATFGFRQNYHSR